MLKSNIAATSHRCTGKYDHMQSSWAIQQQQSNASDGLQSFRNACFIFRGVFVMGKLTVFKHVGKKLRGVHTSLLFPFCVAAHAQPSGGEASGLGAQ